MSQTHDTRCPLCGGAPTHYLTDSRREYWQCGNCALVFVPRRYHLDPAAEKAIYDRHENTLDDPGYRRFLSRMAEPLLDRLAVPGRGLDFGCGPAPLLARMFEDAGHRMALYDCYYAPDATALQGPYDFITATETIEHLAAPATVFARWVKMLAPGGWLGVMTKRVIDRDAFASWHYKNDSTHVAFFSEATFTWLARRYRLELEIVGPDVVLMRKASKPHETGA